MGKYQKLLLQILGGESDRNISFDAICRLLESMGFEKRIRGSHHVFRKPGIPEKINLQCEGTNAKAYQVAQVRGILVKYRLTKES